MNDIISPWTLSKALPMMLNFDVPMSQAEISAFFDAILAEPIEVLPPVPDRKTLAARFRSVRAAAALL